MTRINSTPSPIAARASEAPEAAKPAAVATEAAAPAAAKGWQAGAPKRIEAPPPPATAPMHVDSANAPLPASTSKQAADVAIQFYDAFVHQNSAGMEKAYSPDVHFKDTLFEFGDRAGTMKMWSSIQSKAGDKPHFEYTVDSVTPGKNGDTVKGHWEADYHLLGRPVHNEVQSQMVVRDGKIVDHQDSYSWSKWARQAFPLGPLVDFPGARTLLTALIHATV